MVQLTNIATEVQIMMLKSKGRLNDVSNKNKNANQKIWPLLVQKKISNGTEELRSRETNTSNPLRLGTNDRNGYSSSRNNDSESFHCAIGPILGLAQFFGICPLSGVRSPTPSQLRFAKWSFRTAYTIVITSMVLFSAILSVIYTVKTLNTNTFDVGATAGAVFYGNSLVGTIMFFRLAPRWVSLQCDWRTMEQFIDSNTSESPRLRWKFLALSITVLLLALIEHVLSIFNNIEGYEWHASENSTFRTFLEVYSSKSHSFILETLEYNMVLGIYIFIVSKLATFTWNFTDLFVMLVSTGLAERYKSLNNKVKTIAVKRRSSIDWRELREDYALLSATVKKVDNDISGIILLSFVNNLYFICFQLLNGLSNPHDITLLSAIYFFGSFAFLIGRMCAVTLLTARINDQSKVALPYLYNCSASSYNTETQRLQHQLTTDEIVLTGLRFFSITRNFMLAVAGAIVTYEVVLLQFKITMDK